MDTDKLTNGELYRTLMQRAARNEDWAAYFLLINACYEIVKGIPQTQSACDAADIEHLLIGTIEQLGKAIHAVLPGGAEEFAGYMPRLADSSAKQR